MPEEGDKFHLKCDHDGCKRYIVMTMGNPSMGYAYHKKHGMIDMRNQVWLCPDHKKGKS